MIRTNKQAPKDWRASPGLDWLRMHDVCQEIIGVDKTGSTGAVWQETLDALGI